MQALRADTNGARPDVESVEPVEPGPEVPRAADAPPVASVASVVRASTADDVRSAVDAARAAQEHWRLRPLDERVAPLRGAAKEMLRRRSEAIDLARREMGKVDAEALFNEALGPLD